MADDGDEINATNGTVNVGSLPDQPLTLGNPIMPVDPGNVSSTIFGGDNRTIVPNTSKAPYSKIVMIESHYAGQAKNEFMQGTGELIGPNTVLTAGHCVIEKEDGNARPQWIKVYEGLKPGANGQPTAKLEADGTSSSYLTAYKNAPIVSQQRYDNDLGVIKLNKNLGSQVGTFGLTTSEKVGENVTLTGFSGDKYPNMTTASGKITGLTTNRESYQIDMLPGASGSGLFDSNQRITAINTYENKTENFGTRINLLKMDYINYWLGSPKAHNYGKNVTVSSPDTLWGNLTFTKTKTKKATVGADYSAKYTYNNPNGSSYLSLYDKNGKWAGYINKGGTKDLNAVSYNKTVTVSTKNQWFWGDLLWSTTKHSTNTYLNKKVTAKRYYTLGNGKRFYSIYSGTSWLGYLNAAYTK